MKSAPALGPFVPSPTVILGSLYWHRRQYTLRLGQFSHKSYNHHILSSNPSKPSTMAWNFQARRKSYVEIWEPVALGVWSVFPVVFCSSFTKKY